MKKIKLISMIIIISGFMILNSSHVEAALQANQYTQYTTKKKHSVWMLEFRNMEQTGQGMGLDEKLNDDLTFLDKSNNIDVHMMRNTEYGAIAILSASGYGNPNNSQVIYSTTGNSTGVIIDTNKDNWEFVAGGMNGSIFSGVDSRYYDTYTASNTSARIGDALGNANTLNPGCAGWHGAALSTWVTATLPYLARGGGGVFSFSTADNSNDSRWFRASRGVAVCGVGL